MKKETRQVTIERDVYVAEDGREFFDKCDCEKYDFELLEKTLKFYDRIFEDSDFESCTYVNLKTAEDVTKIIQLCDYNGVSEEGLVNPGVYMYDTYRDRWVNITEAVARIEGD